jgi:hypothetical protein
MNRMLNTSLNIVKLVKMTYIPDWQVDTNQVNPDDVVSDTVDSPVTVVIVDDTDNKQTPSNQ